MHKDVIKIKVYIYECSVIYLFNRRRIKILNLIHTIRDLSN